MRFYAFRSLFEPKSAGNLVSREKIPLSFPACIKSFCKFTSNTAYEELKDPKKFEQFGLQGTVFWSNGADIAPEYLYQHGSIA